MASTSYCSSSLIRLGGGWEKFSPCSFVSIYRVKREAWKTGWIVQWCGSQSLYVTSDGT